MSIYSSMYPNLKFGQPGVKQAKNSLFAQLSLGAKPAVNIQRPPPPTFEIKPEPKPEPIVEIKPEPVPEPVPEVKPIPTPEPVEIVEDQVESTPEIKEKSPPKAKAKRKSPAYSTRAKGVLPKPTPSRESHLPQAGERGLQSKTTIEQKREYYLARLGRKSVAKAEEEVNQVQAVLEEVGGTVDGVKAKEQELRRQLKLINYSKFFATDDRAEEADTELSETE